MNKKIGVVILVIAIAMLVVGEVLSFNESKVKVSFNNIDDPYTVYVDKDGYLEKTSDPIRIGYSFLGWYKNDEYFDFNEKITGDTLLEAKWEKTDDSNSNTKQVIGNSLFEIVRSILNFN